MKHGYGAYATGCRCDVCREAKRVYISQRRKAAVAARLAGEPLGSLKHGSRYGYEERGCRCAKCSLAHEASDKRSRHWKGTP